MSPACVRNITELDKFIAHCRKMLFSFFAWRLYAGGYSLILAIEMWVHDYAWIWSVDCLFWLAVFTFYQWLAIRFNKKLFHAQACRRAEMFLDSAQNSSQVVLAADQFAAHFKEL